MYLLGVPTLALAKRNNFRWQKQAFALHSEILRLFRDWWGSLLTQTHDALSPRMDFIIPKTTWIILQGIQKILWLLD
jgi:hypothetical protein